MDFKDMFGGIGTGCWMTFAQIEDTKNWKLLFTDQD